MTTVQAIYGIIGNPLTHTLSPAMHNAAFQALNVNAEYRTFPLEPDELKLFMEDLREPGNPIFGLNVTVPYKEKIIPYLDSVNPFAVKVGAVNTIVISRERKLHGFNTDGPGFLAHLAELGFNQKGKRIAILGAGGTTRAILSVLCLLPDKPEWVRVYNRTTQKAKDLVADLATRMDDGCVHVVNTIDDLDIELADCLINTTTVGLNPADPCLVDPGQLHKDMLVYDVIYNPAETKLLKAAKDKGARTANGLSMLIYQGVLSFQHWANIQLDDKLKDIMRRALETKGAS